MLLLHPNTIIGNVPYSCDYCYNIGYRPKSQANHALKNNQMTFCSRACQGKHNTASLVKQCAECNLEIVVVRNELKTNNFCNRGCAARYNNKNRRHSSETKAIISKSMHTHHSEKPTRFKTCMKCGNEFPHSRRKTCSKECLHLFSQDNGRMAGIKSAQMRPRRSRDEIKLFNLIKAQFDTANHNVPVVGVWDADIVLPEMKVAILWNGRWHREQLSFSNHSLKQVQNRDRIKTKEFEDAGWKVLVYEDDVWTPETAFANFLHIVT